LISSPPSTGRIFITPFSMLIKWIWRTNVERKAQSATGGYIGC
jgi:hypothetical protein